MVLRFQYYNNASNLLNDEYSTQWRDLRGMLEEMPLYLKASDQRNRVGRPIFDPKATNSHIKNALQTSWNCDVSIPEQFTFLGNNIDFEHSGLIVEVQFSNYPFLLNNVIRSELFYRSYTQFSTENTSIVAIITKAGELPASNSTLYYEQAEYQLESLRRNSIFNIPIALIGLFPPSNDRFPAIWTDYDDPRYSRTVIDRREVTISVNNHIYSVE
jgi:hypothetical protein